MKKEEKVFWKLENIIHPETGENDLKEILRYVVTRVNAEPETKKTDGLYNVFAGSLSGRIGAYGMTHVPGILAIMQEIGLARMRKRKGLWEICDDTFFDGFMSSAETVARCVEDANRRRATVDELKKLERRLADRTEQESEAEEASLSEIAGLIVDNEELRKKVSDLERELAETRRGKKNSMNAKLAEAIRKAREERHPA